MIGDLPSQENCDQCPKTEDEVPTSKIFSTNAGWHHLCNRCGPGHTRDCVGESGNDEHGAEGDVESPPRITIQNEKQPRHSASGKPPPHGTKNRDLPLEQHGEGRL